VRTISRPALAILTLVLVAGCGGAAGPAALPTDAADAAAPAPADAGAPPADLAGPGGDAAAPADAAPREIAPPLPDTNPRCPVGCPAELCDEASRRCLACETTADCLRGEWCRGGGCVRTTCVPGEGTCDGFDVRLCEADGQDWGPPTACPEGERCTLGVCQPVVCEPGETRCEDLRVAECNPAGTGWLSSLCQPGAACQGDQGCVPYKNTVLLVFDTSGSMSESAPAGMGRAPCICPAGCPAVPYPACEKPLCPRSKLGLSKYVFMQVFSIISRRDLHFVMHRFPQQVTRTEGGCLDMMGTGHYQIGFGVDFNRDFMALDDGSHTVADGSWYDQEIDQLVCVPYPRTPEEDTFAQARRWMDFDEQVGRTDEACAVDADCLAGWCDADPDVAGRRVCFRHTNPELRGIGGTPLGKSLFYAAEYIRKYVAPEGKPCTTDADCANVDYRCATGPAGAGACFDPLAHCRRVSVILFTDGLEDPATSAWDFFNPRVQAKRMRYGLACAAAADCGEGARCEGGVCAGYERPNGSLDAPPHPTNPDPWRLSTYGGRALQVTTHVVDLGTGEGATTNRLIADEGGGRYVNVSADDLQGFIDALLAVTDVKQTLACEPRYPPGWTDRE
jgi:hypothetical protein